MLLITNQPATYNANNVANPHTFGSAVTQSQNNIILEVRSLLTQAQMNRLNGNGGAVSKNLQCILRVSAHSDMRSPADTQLFYYQSNTPRQLYTAHARVNAWQWWQLLWRYHDKWQRTERYIAGFRGWRTVTHNESAFNHGVLGEGFEIFDYNIIGGF